MDTDYSGELWIDGQLMNGKSEPELARIRNEKIGFVFQFHYLLNEFTVLRNVMLPGLKLNPEHKEVVEQRAYDLLKLLGIELPLLLKVANNIYYKAFIDFALYDEDLNKVYIYDIKTSTRGWSDSEKRDDQKTAQVLLYKEYFSRQFGWDVEQIEVEFFIVKRKIYEEAEYPIPRVQSFKPASGKTKRRQSIERFEDFIKDCFDEVGKPQIKSYIKNVGESACKWCPYNNNNELCNKVAGFI
jgi:hypothetical protein